MLVLAGDAIIPMPCPTADTPLANFINVSKLFGSTSFILSVNVTPSAAVATG